MIVDSLVVKEDVGRQSATEIAKQSGFGQDTFLKLLVTQLKNQDPTNPVENEEFLAQMAQFTSLEQMVELNKSMKSFSSAAVRSDAVSILGKNVTINVAANAQIGGGSAESLRVTGVVDRVSFEGGDVRVEVKGTNYSINDVVEVKPAE